MLLDIEDLKTMIQLNNQSISNYKRITSYLVAQAKLTDALTDTKIKHRLFVLACCRLLACFLGTANVVASASAPLNL